MGCANRITGGEASYCFLQSSRASDDDSSMKDLVFHGARPNYPIKCDGLMLSVCPFREADAEPVAKGPLVHCAYCHRRHRTDSTAKRLCEDWHSVKSVLKEMREREPPLKYFEEGTTILPYRQDTPGLVRQLIWQRLKGAILRRDRHTCQNCGEMFGGVRRKVRDASARHGRGGPFWESLEVHHIIPRSRGGSDHPGNLKTLCPACHRTYTIELRMDSMEARRREFMILSRIKELDEEVSDWDAPVDY